MGSSADAESPEKAVHDAYKVSVNDESVPFSTVVFHELNGGGVDDLNNEEATARMRYYQPGLSGTPDLEFDGGYVEIGGFSTSQRPIDGQNVDWAVTESKVRYDNVPLRPRERLAWSFPYLTLEVDQIFDGSSFYVEGKVSYDGNAKTVGAPVLRGSLYIFMVENNVTAFSKVYGHDVVNDAVFRGYAIEGQEFTLNNNAELPFSATWDLPGSKVPVKPQDVLAIAAVFDTSDSTSQAGTNEGNSKGAIRCVQSATSTSTAYDRANSLPSVSGISLTGKSVSVTFDDDSGVAQAFLFYNEDAPNATKWNIVQLVLSGGELCDDAGVCYAYSDAIGTADIDIGGKGIYAQVLVYDDMKAQSVSEVFPLGEVGETSSKGSMAFPLANVPVLLVLGALIIMLGPLFYFLGKGRKGGIFKLLSNKGALMLFIAIGIVLVAESARSLLVPSTTTVPDFSVTDTKGKAHSPGDYDGRVLVLDFMFADCSVCNKGMPDVVDVYRTAKERYGDDVEFLSISILKDDTNRMLDDFMAKYDAEWPIARGSDYADDFDALSVPKMVIVAPNGDIAYTHVSLIDKDDVLSAIKAAKDGTYKVRTIVQGGGSVLALGMTATFLGVLTFLSPCSFPMLPGYFTYYIKAQNDRGGKRISSLLAGSLSALGIITFFLLIGIAVAIFGSLVSSWLIFLLPVMGVIIFLLGLLTVLGKDAFLEKGMDLIKAPFVWAISKVRGQRTEDSGAGGLFAYGFGYGAASSSCMALPFIFMVLMGFSIGFLGGILAFIIYSLTIGTMMVVFSTLASSSSTFINYALRSSAKVKLVSGILMMAAGVLILLYNFWLYKYFGWLLSF